MAIRLILVILIILIIVIILLVPLVYLRYKNVAPSKVEISNQVDGTRKLCQRYPVPCDKNDKDFCANTCIDDMEYSCQDVYLPTFGNDNRGKIGEAKSFCLPEKRAPEYECDIKVGCVPTWTGWGSTNRMEFDSLCMFPDYYGGNACAPTPGVCTLNNQSYMKFDATRDGAPGPQHCVLPESLQGDYEVIRREDGTPLIVLKSQRNFYKDQTIPQAEISSIILRSKI